MLVPRVLPAAAADVSAPALADRVRSSADVGWSGQVSTVGTLAVPDVDSFGGVADLLGESSDLRVWWRDAEHWRVDKTSSSGESDLARRGDRAATWSFESRRATTTRYSSVRLPDTSDVLPATLARRMLSGAKDADLSRLPAKRVEGHSSAGLRLVPSDARTTISRVDLWADEKTGVATRVEVYAGGRLPVLTTTAAHLDLARPSAEDAGFSFADAVDVRQSYALDDAAGANAFAPFVPPDRVAGLRRTGDLDGAVGVYGRGTTALLAIPLRRDIAREAFAQLEESPAAKRDDDGISLAVGPVSVRLEGAGRGVFLLTGTVTPDTLDRAGEDLGSVRFRPGRGESR
ncbi:hypothetical protein GCM10011519_08970 [Marmoricola endophyticus]|uniref:Sigma E regulatory protein, MucB/RseB n=1 Tax=Marmoricola endophyticus TaxID=2040280 RepID=A0A917EZQ4_9ACTN|nr:hypothetical protein GCM10011519_08970 [Marmoricola endophyticus]